VFAWITNLIETFGYLGIFALMFLENLFPPIPSEVIMPLAGYTAATGALHPLGVLIAGFLGSFAGALFWYVVGRLFGLSTLKRAAGRFGRVLTVSPAEIDVASRWFLERGQVAVCLGRMIPTVRTLISVPAGLTRMQIFPFMLYSAIGTALWTTLLFIAGYLLEDRYELIGGYLDPVTNLIIAFFVGLYVYRLWTWRPHEVPQP
jgi:membrane protein DedA with SNARE-associated domain